MVNIFKKKVKIVTHCPEKFVIAVYSFLLLFDSKGFTTFEPPLFILFPAFLARSWDIGSSLNVNDNSTNTYLVRHCEYFEPFDGHYNLVSHDRQVKAHALSKNCAHIILRYNFPACSNCGSI